MLNRNKKFKNIHRNERAFVVCNGPSLNMVDVTRLETSIVFAMNRGYLKTGLPITYLTTVDPIVENQFKDEILAVGCVAKWSSQLPVKGNMYRWCWTPDIPNFTGDITKPIWQGHSVTNPTLQLAYFMGCNPVYIIGMDHYLSYDEYKKVNGNYETVEEDVNHFDPNYFGPGKRFHGQDLKSVELGYKLAYKAYTKDNRVLRNASAQTKLSEDIIPRIEFREIFKQE